VTSSATAPTAPRLAVSPKLFTRFALASFIALGLIVISGAAVRLTGSGLGCPDWPSCYQHQLTASDNLHPIIEFGNRMVTIALVIVFAATVVAAYLRTPKRRDLIWLSWALIAGVVGDAVIGGIVVYTKLNPYLVMVHMWFSLAMLAVARRAARLRARSAPPGCPGRKATRPEQSGPRRSAAPLARRPRRGSVPAPRRR